MIAQLSTILRLIDKQEEDVTNYINEYMTQEERDMHGSNICSFLLKSQSVEALVGLMQMADGQRTKTDDKEYKWEVPQLQQPTVVVGGDIRTVNLPVQVVFEWSDKIVSDYDSESGTVLEYTSGYIMKVLPNQQFVYNGESTTFTAQASIERS